MVDIINNDGYKEPTAKAKVVKDSNKTYYPEEQGFYVIDNPVAANAEHKPKIIVNKNGTTVEPLPNGEVRGVPFLDSLRTVPAHIITLFDRPFVLPVVAIPIEAYYVDSKDRIFPSAKLDNLWPRTLPSPRKESGITLPRFYDLIMEKEPEKVRNLKGSPLLLEDGKYRVTVEAKPSFRLYIPAIVGVEEVVTNSDGEEEEVIVPKRVLFEERIKQAHITQLVEMGKIRHGAKAVSDYVRVMFELDDEELPLGTPFVLFKASDFTDKQGNSPRAAVALSKIETLKPKMKKIAPLLKMEPLGIDALEKLAVLEYVKLWAKVSDEDTLEGKLKQYYYKEIGRI
jgi:hypothetical protein